jgi:primosomal protein N' (replication factor Y)
MFAELVINIEAALTGTFHYDVPRDLRPLLRVGHLVEVEFGRRLAQGIVIGFAAEAPVEDTKPVLSLIDEQPVVWPWQIELARWLSEQYLAPLNSCLRLMLPPGLTRWADMTLDVNPRWDGNGRLTPAQKTLIELLQEKGDLRGRQVQKALRKHPDFAKTDWKTVANQLANRDILRKASVLDPPRVRPKKIRTAELSASWARVQKTASQLGRKNLQANVLDYLAELDDPLPPETAVLTATGASEKLFQALAEK